MSSKREETAEELQQLVQARYDASEAALKYGPCTITLPCMYLDTPHGGPNWHIHLMNLPRECRAGVEEAIAFVGDQFDMRK